MCSRAASAQARLLAQTPQSAALLSALGVTPMTPGDLLAQLVPAWQQLLQPAREAALHFLVSEWHTLQANERLVELLTELAFVQSCGSGAGCSCVSARYCGMSCFRHSGLSQCSEGRSGAQPSTLHCIP